MPCEARDTPPSQSWPAVLRAFGCAAIVSPRRLSFSIVPNIGGFRPRVMTAKCRASLAMASFVWASSKIRQREEKGYVTSFFNPDAISIQNPARDRGHLQPFGATAGPLRPDQKFKHVGLTELANARQAVPCIRRNRFVRPCPTERTLRLAHGPNHANTACYFTGPRPEHQLRFIKAPLIRAS